MKKFLLTFSYKKEIIAGKNIFEAFKKAGYNSDVLKVCSFKEILEGEYNEKFNNNSKKS